MEPANLIAEDLSKTYSDGTTAVQGVSFKAGNGITVLMGPNGSGKTTTLSMISGSLKPTRGKVTVCGYDLWGSGWYKARECIGYAPQNMPFIEHLTAMENLVWLGLMRGLSLGEARKRASSLLELVGLEDSSNKRVARLSGGMRRRLTIAASLIGSPRIVVLDEPTSGLDPGAREALWKIIAVISRDKTVLVSTHIPEEAEEHADKVLIFHKGRIVADGTPRTLIEKYAPLSVIELQGIFPETKPDMGMYKVWSKNKIVVESTDPDSDLPRILEEIISIGGKVSLAKIRKPGLREVYLTLTGESLEEV
ncbi:MAG: ABC transporter ATP-binding protein [Desulfurococcales archaeon]|nr:ABC transporter ATP-binding protein [Desulfurococcales archaeon]MEB3786885.1 ABC transporter ATP-binding protein [Desulfurococcales archaeon]